MPLLHVQALMQSLLRDQTLVNHRVTSGAFGNFAEVLKHSCANKKIDGLVQRLLRNVLLLINLQDDVLVAQLAQNSFDRIHFRLLLSLGLVFFSITTFLGALFLSQFLSLLVVLR